MNSYRRTILGPDSDPIRHPRRGVSTRPLVTVLFEVFLIGCGFQALFLIAPFNLTTSHLSSNSTSRRSAFQLAVLSNGQQIWTQLDNGEIVIIEPATRRRQRVFLPKGRPFISSAVSDDASTYMYAVNGRTISIVRNQELLVYEELPTSNEPSIMALSRNGATAIRISLGTDVRIWDLSNTNAEPSEFQLPQSVDGVALHPSGRTIAVSAIEGWLSIYDVKTHQLIQNILVQEEVTGEPAFSPDERWLSIPCSRSVVLYDLVSERIVWTIPTMGPNRVSSTAISPDGKWVASLELFSGVQIVELSTGQLKHTISNSFINKLAFSPSGASFHTTGNDNLIREWSLSTGREIDRFVLSE